MFVSIFYPLQASEEDSAVKIKLEIESGRIEPIIDQENIDQWHNTLYLQRHTYHSKVLDFVFSVKSACRAYYIKRWTSILLYVKCPEKNGWSTWCFWSCTIAKYIYMVGSCEVMSTDRSLILQKFWKITLATLMCTVFTQSSGVIDTCWCLCRFLQHNTQMRCPTKTATELGLLDIRSDEFKALHHRRIIWYMDEAKNLN